MEKRCCPECKSTAYLFRSRKKIVEDGKPEAVETKYRCKECGHEWRERTTHTPTSPSGGLEHGKKEHKQ